MSDVIIGRPSSDAKVLWEKYIWKCYDIEHLGHATDRAAKAYALTPQGSGVQLMLVEPLTKESHGQEGWLFKVCQVTN